MAVKRILTAIFSVIYKLNKFKRRKVKKLK